MTRKSEVKDKDILAVGPALERAAKAARRIAALTNTPIAIWENGKVVLKWPEI